MVIKSKKFVTIFGWGLIISLILFLILPMVLQDIYFLNYQSFFFLLPSIFHNTHYFQTVEENKISFYMAYKSFNRYIIRNIKYDPLYRFVVKEKEVYSFKGNLLKEYRMYSNRFGNPQYINGVTIQGPGKMELLERLYYSNGKYYYVQFDGDSFPNKPICEFNNLKLLKSELFVPFITKITDKNYLKYENSKMYALKNNLNYPMNYSIMRDGNTIYLENKYEKFQIYPNYRDIYYSKSSFFGVLFVNLKKKDAANIYQYKSFDAIDLSSYSLIYDILTAKSFDEIYSKIGKADDFSYDLSTFGHDYIVFNNEGDLINYEIDYYVVYGYYKFNNNNDNHISLWVSKDERSDEIKDIVLKIKLNTTDDFKKILDFSFSITKEMFSQFIGKNKKYILITKEEDNSPESYFRVKYQSIYIDIIFKYNLIDRISLSLLKE